MGERGTYRSTYSAMLDSKEFLALSPDARLVLHTVKNSRINNMAGIFLCGRGDLGIISEQSGLSDKRVSKAIRELSDTHWIGYREGILWVRNQLRYDPHITLANEKQRIGIQKIISSLQKSEILANFCEYYKLAYPFDRVSNGHRYPMPYTEPEPEPEPEIETDKEEDKKKSAASFSVKKFIGIYHEYCPFGQKVEVVDHRKRKIKARIKEHPDLDWWIALYKTKIVPSKFLRGEVDPREGQKRFLLSIDFILRPIRLADIIEGKYVDGKSRERLSWADEERLKNKAGVGTDRS